MLIIIYQYGIKVFSHKPLTEQDENRTFKNMDPIFSIQLTQMYKNGMGVI